MWSVAAAKPPTCSGSPLAPAAAALSASVLPGDWRRICFPATAWWRPRSSTIRRWPTDPLWSRKLAEMVPDARHGPIVGVNSVVSDPADKRKLHAFTRAVAVDMESHLVARLADAHGLAFAAVRVIIDPAHRAVPPAALLAMAPGGSTDVSAILREILARPSQVSPLMRLAADALAARVALVRLRRALGPSFSWE